MGKLQPRSEEVVFASFVHHEKERRKVGVDDDVALIVLILMKEALLES